ncbi:MAG: SdpI family protein [Clostridia bacterium]|nr:SdpI family protein [Clostridia bacterium]
MMKQYKWKLLVSSLLILLPILFGIGLWNELPQQMATHWGLDGKANGWSTPLFAVVFFPLLLLCAHWICIWVTARDKKNAEQSEKVFGMIFWIIPIISLYANSILYATAFGMDLNISTLSLVLIGVCFILIGNYLPKCKQNNTIGIKISWTLANEENWNYTHRLGGRVWVIVGILTLLCVFLPAKVLPAVLILSILSAVGIPFLSSYLFYKKQLREGRATKEDYQMKKISKAATVVVLIAVAMVIAFCLIICFTGNIEMRYDGDSFHAKADYYDDLYVAYDTIREIEYRDSFDGGERIVGFGSPRLSMGSFRNEEFGAYIRYSYTRCDACVVLRIEGNQTVVLSGTDQEQTKAIYNMLSSKISK